VLDQLRSLVEAHAGDEDEVAVLSDLCRADGASATRGVARVAPPQRFDCRDALGDDPLQLGALRAVHRRDVGEVVRRGRPVAEHQVHLLPGLDAVRLHLLGVRGELQQGADLGVPGELGVVDLVLAAVVADDEVREADEAGGVCGRCCVERRLVQHVGTVGEGLSCFGCGACVVRRGGAVELDDVAGLLEYLEVVELVLVPQPCSAFEHVVVHVGQGFPATELGVEAAQERPLAGRPRAQVTRAEQHVPVDADLHALPRLYGALKA